MPHPFAPYRPLIGDWEAFCQVLRSPLPTCIWANPLKTTPERLHGRLEKTGFAPRPLAWHPGAFRLPDTDAPGTTIPFRTGHYHVQEEVSLLPVVLLDPQPGERVLDLCAAPGGKTAQIATRMKNRGTVVANDRDTQRMRALRGTIDRLGLMNVTATIYDAANYPPEASRFDRVLADVPCSCEGTSRKHADEPEAVASPDKFTGLQTAILRKAVQLCRPGGRVVYSTCTYAPEENEAVVDTVLREHSDTLRLAPARVPGFSAGEGLTHWQGRAFDPSLKNALRVWPHQNDTGGFFVAVLRKNGGMREWRNGSKETSDGLLEQHAEIADPGRWLPVVTKRFGIAPEALANYRLLRPNRKKLYLVPPDHRPPERPAPHAFGLPFLRIKMAYPKLSTAAAMLLGEKATRHVADVREAQARAYLRREPITLSSTQAHRCTSRGYVLVRLDGMTLGVGFYRPEDHIVRSLFPKAWTLG